MTTTELATRNTLMSGEEFEQLQRIAKMLSVSSLFSAKGNDPVAIAQTAVKIMAGQEMGFGPFASVQNIHVIHGNPSVSAHLIATAIKAHPRYDYKIIRWTEEECVIQFFEDGKPNGDPFSYTIADAKAADLLNKDMWKKYTRAMLFARAISAGYRGYCPDALGSARVYVLEEMGAKVDESGNAIVVDGRVLMDEEESTVIESTATRFTMPENQQLTVDEPVTVESTVAESTVGLNHEEVDFPPKESTVDESTVDEYFSPYANLMMNTDYDIPSNIQGYIMSYVTLNKDSKRMMSKVGFEHLCTVLQEKEIVEVHQIVPFFELLCQAEFPNDKLPGSLVGKPLDTDLASESGLSNIKGIANLVKVVEQDL